MSETPTGTAIDAEERKKTSSADNIFADLAELPSTFALRYPSPQAAWAHGVRQNAPLSTADAGRLRQKMRLAYAAWTGRDLEGDLHDDRFRPTPSETT